MQEFDLRIGVPMLITAGFMLAACDQGTDVYNKIEPAQVEHIEGSKLSTVKLTEKAIERLDLRTSIVRETQVEANGGVVVRRKVVPYSSIIYDTSGDTWVYISPEPRQFVRHQVAVDYIKGDEAVLVDGPPKDSVIATVGVAELYGAELGIGH